MYKYDIVYVVVAIVTTDLILTLKYGFNKYATDSSDKSIQIKIIYHVFKINKTKKKKI